MNETKTPTTSSDEEIKRIPIYPPEVGKSVIYWTVTFVTFIAATIYMIQLLIILTGFGVFCTSAQLGEQLYKRNIWKEVLYYRALRSALDDKQL